MKNQQNFSKNLSDVISGLRDAVKTLGNKIEKEKTHLADLKSRRTKLVQRYVSELLPDLETATLERLRSVRGFNLAKITPVFQRVHQIPMPLWSRITGGAAKKRVEKFAFEFQMIQTQLTSFIDRNTLDPEFRNVQVLTQDISDSMTAIAKLENKKVPITTDLAQAEKMYQQMESGVKKTIPPKFAEHIDTLATGFREVRGGKAAQSRPRVQVENQTRSQYGDDTDLIIFWATGFPTSGRTFLMDAFASHPSSDLTPQPVFEGGGGLSGGGGASGSFDQPGSVQSVDSSQDSQLVTSSDDPIATDDSLGRYS